MNSRSTSTPNVFVGLYGSSALSYEGTTVSKCIEAEDVEAASNNKEESSKGPKVLIL